MPPPDSDPADPSASATDATSSTTPAKRGILFRISASIDNVMRRSFFRLGLFVARRPLKVILVSVIFMVITLAGLLRFRSESRAEKLWVPQGTVALDNQKYVNSYYGRTNRFSAIAFTAKNGNNLLTRKAFLEMTTLAEAGLNTTADPLDEAGADNTITTWLERCLTTVDSKGNQFCRTSSAFNLFYDTNFIVRNQNGTVNFFATIRNKLNTLTDNEIRATLEKPPAIIFDNSPFNRNESYASTGTGSSFKVNVISYYQFIRNQAIVKDGELIDPDADALEEKWTKFILKANEPSSQFLTTATAFVDSAWSQEESLSEALSGDLPLLSFGFVLLGIYVTLFLGDFHAVRSHMWLAVGALLTTGLAMGTCFGLSSLTGMFFGPVHQILPLLIIGIGIDDCFHITRAVDEVNFRDDANEKPVESRIALALSTSGSAITVTSFTNVVVFLLSAISRLPALRYFSLWAAIGIFFAWVYAVTFYTALVTLDARRIQGKRRDCCPCFKVEEVKELNWFKKRAGAFSRFFGEWYGPFIMRGPVRIVLLVLFAAGLGASIYGCTQLYLKFRFSFFYPSGSSQRDYQDVIDKYYELGDDTHVYVRNTSLRIQENREKFLQLCDPSTGVMAKNEWVQKGTVDCWYVVMRRSNNVAEGTFDDADTFIRNVITFANSSRYTTSIIFNEDKTDVVATRFALQYVYRKTNNDEIDSLESMRKAADSVGFGDDDEGNPKAFPYVFFDTFSEQYAALPGEIGISLGLACLAVGVVCVLLIGHPLVALVSLLVVGMIIISVLGLTYFSDVNLNSVSVITLVLCAGISVDFVVHISRSFLEHVGSRTERAIKALATMGPPVFYAGFSTFLAIVILSVAKSYIFQVIFKGFLFLIAMAFLHGLILGPILLSLIGPRSFFADEAEKEGAEKQLEELVTGGMTTKGSTDDEAGVEMETKEEAQV